MEKSGFYIDAQETPPPPGGGGGGGGGGGEKKKGELQFLHSFFSTSENIRPPVGVATPFFSPLPPLP